MPVSRGLVTTQSGRGNPGSSRSTSPIGARASIFRLRLSVSGSGTDSGVVPKSSARIAAQYDGDVRCASGPHPPVPSRHMATQARLALTRVRIDGVASDLYVYDDRLVVTTEAGDRVIPMGRLERVATRRTWRGGAKLLLALSGD